MWLTTSTLGSLVSRFGLVIVLLYWYSLFAFLAQPLRLPGTAPLRTGPGFTSHGYSPNTTIYPTSVRSILSLTKGRDARRFGVDLGLSRGNYLSLLESFIY